MEGRAFEDEIPSVRKVPDSEYVPVGENQDSEGGSTPEGKEEARGGREVRKEAQQDQCILPGWKFTNQVQGDGI